MTRPRLSAGCPAAPDFLFQRRSATRRRSQRAAVINYLNGGMWELVGEFVEVESGKHSDRPRLEEALQACRKNRAKLVIAKLDRLSRNLAFIATLMESGIEFVAVDNPHANKLTVHILAAVAQHEREAAIVAGIVVTIFAQ